VKRGKNLAIGMLILGLAAVVLVGCSTAQAAPPAVGEQELGRYITVVGRGEVSLTPDIAQVNVGAEATAETVSEAKAEVDSRMEAILAALKEMGIAEKDIQTSQYNIYYEREPFFEPGRGESAAENEGFYRVSSMLNVTIREIERAGEVVDAAVEAGANRMYGVSFTVSETVEWESEAREKAMADARARAEELAGLAEVTLGEVLSVSEVVGSGPVVVERFALDSRGGGGIVPGELEFSTQIQVSFAIE